MNTFKKWQNQETSLGRQVLFLGIGALIFPVSIPLILVLLLPPLDTMIGLGSFFIGPVNIVIGIILLLFGGLLAFWTIFAQIRFASGTPFPMLPTKKLIIIGPFKYCRNPMTLGTVLMYFGIALMVGSVASLLFVVLFMLALVAYIKLVEEKELELRFGVEYLDYKNDTPFMIPVRFAARKKK